MRDGGFMRPYRDAELVIVTSNTGAIGPRLLPRGPPGPKAADPAYYHGALRAPKQQTPPITTGPSGPQSSYQLCRKRAISVVIVSPRHHLSPVQPFAYGVFNKISSMPNI